MKTQNINTNATRFLLVAAAAVGMLLFGSITPSFGQKEQAERATTRVGLTQTGFMTNPEFTDDLDGTDDEYFYKFQARPGKLTVTLEVVANETNAGAYLDLFGANSKAILSNILAQGVDGGSERVTKSVNLSKAQEIVIRIKGLKYGSSDGYRGTYKVLLEGPAASFANAAPADGPAQENKLDTALPGSMSGQSNDPAALVDGTVPEKQPEAASSDITGQNKIPDVTPSDVAGQDKKPAAAPTNQSGPDKRPDVVDRAIEKGKAKSNKVLQILNKVKAKIPD